MPLPRSSAPTRPRRFPLRLPLRYRVAGSSDWHKGTSDNVSCAGLLLRGRYRVERAMPLEVMLRLPRQIAGDAPVMVVCGGHVVRTLAPGFLFGRWGFGVALVDYRLVYSEQRPEAQMRQALRAETLRKFSADVSHQLNDLLAVVIGNSDLILGQPNLEHQLRQYAASIKTAAERMAALVRQLTNPGKS